MVSNHVVNTCNMLVWKKERSCNGEGLRLCWCSGAGAPVGPVFFLTYEVN